MDQSSCPENVRGNWEYWMEWYNKWEEDGWMEAVCSDDNSPTDGPVSNYIYFNTKFRFAF